MKPLVFATLGAGLVLTSIASLPCFANGAIFGCTGTRNPSLRIKGYYGARCGDHPPCLAWVKLSATLPREDGSLESLQLDLYGSHSDIDLFEVGTYQESVPGPVELRIDFRNDETPRLRSYLRIRGSEYALHCSEGDPDYHGPYGMGGIH